jgi:hypothetical protein
MGFYKATISKMKRLYGGLSEGEKTDVFLNIFAYILAYWHIFLAICHMLNWKILNMPYAAAQKTS